MPYTAFFSGDAIAFRGSSTSMRVLGTRLSDTNPCNLFATSGGHAGFAWVLILDDAFAFRGMFAM